MNAKSNTRPISSDGDVTDNEQQAEKDIKELFTEDTITIKGRKDEDIEITLHELTFNESNILCNKIPTVESYLKAATPSHELIGGGGGTDKAKDKSEEDALLNKYIMELMAAINGSLANPNSYNEWVLIVETASNMKKEAFQELPISRVSTILHAIVSRNPMFFFIVLNQENNRAAM